MKQRPESASPVSLALIGLGGIAQSVHLPLIRRNHDLVQLVAVVDLSSERAETIARTNGESIRSFTSVQDLMHAISEGLHVDCAILATGGSHVADVETLICHGIKVLVEKPLGYSQADLDALETVCEDNGINPSREFFIGYMKEHDPAVEYAREALEAISIRSVNVEVLHPADAAQIEFANLLSAPVDIPESVVSTTKQQWSSLRVRTTGTDTGVFADTYTNLIMGSIIHDISLLRHLISPIDSVGYARRWGEFPGSMRFGGDLENGVPWDLSWHFIPDFPAYRETVSIIHESGKIDLVFEVPYILNAATKLTVTSKLPDLGVQDSSSAWSQKEAFEEELFDLVRLVQGDNVDASSLKEAKKDLVVAQKMAVSLSKSLGVSLSDSTELAQVSANLL